MNNIDQISPTHTANQPVNMWCTWANLVTLIRTVIGLLVMAIAWEKQSQTLNFVGLAIYWSLDILDGWLARKLNQETRLGAQFDILADRLLVAFFYFNYLKFHPHAILPVTLFLFEFLLLDHFLSNQFMRWPLLSPNYFYQVSPQLWRLNWSTPAKAINTGFVTLLLLVAPSIAWATGAVIALIALKLYSLVQLMHLEPPNKL
ncbi:MAG: CDP-alcohol phosphatidyltransferase family protein [Myxococcota bacterium]